MELTDPRIQKLVLGLKSGVDLETAAHYAGLSTGEVYRWLERGKVESDRQDNGVDADEEEEKFMTFWLLLKTTRAEAIVRNVAVIQSAANNGAWGAAAWWLERSVPEKFGKAASERRGADLADGDTPRQIEK